MKIYTSHEQRFFFLDTHNYKIPQIKSYLHWVWAENENKKPNDFQISEYENKLFCLDIILKNKNMIDYNYLKFFRKDFERLIK